MKRYIIRIISVVFVVFTGIACSEIIDQTEIENSCITAEFTAVNGCTTKTSLQDDGRSVNWRKGDNILYYSAADGSIRSHSIPFDCQSTSFVATLDGTDFFISAYGASGITSPESDNLILEGVVKANQSGNFSDAHVSVCRINQSEGRLLAFDNITSLIKLNANNDTIRTITFTAKEGVQIHGDGRLNVSFSGNTPSASFLEANDEFSYINLSTNGTDPVYLSTIPCTLHGFLIEAKDADGKLVGIAQSDSTFSIPANSIIDLGNVPLKPVHNKDISVVTPLSFTSGSTQSVYMRKIGSAKLEYSYDQANWILWDGSSVSFGFDGHETIYFRGDNEKGLTTFSDYNDERYKQFGFSKASVPVYSAGNIMSLISYSKIVTTIPSYACFFGLFKDCTPLASAPTLPATVLDSRCYENMFYQCSSLATAPALPASECENYCYSHMFYGCSSLTGTPELPATTLADYCYWAMFRICSNLTDICELPVKSLRQDCYREMFYDCDKIVTAPELPATSLATRCYDEMFMNCNGLLNAPGLSAENMAQQCYQEMFRNCTSLKTAPALPSTSLANNCYDSMFCGCTALEYAPELPAEYMKDHCYYQMFNSCTKLKDAPVLKSTHLADYCYYRMFMNTYINVAPSLPATDLAVGCYQEMFYDCIYLKWAPELPATEMKKRCYYGMFDYCSSLTTAPDLPATVLAEKCYERMFNDCFSLNYIKAMFLTTPSDQYTKDWTKSQMGHPSGTFVKNVNATWDVSGDNGIPAGWTVQTASE